MSVSDLWDLKWFFYLYNLKILQGTYHLLKTPLNNIPRPRQKDVDQCISISTLKPVLIFKFFIIHRSNYTYNNLKARFTINSLRKVYLRSTQPPNCGEICINKNPLLDTRIEPSAPNFHHWLMAPPNNIP